MIRQPLRSRLSSAATLVSLMLFLASAVVAVGGFDDGQAEAAKPLSCGDTITADATLHHDLVNCRNNGILIGADDVTLDLNYHTIDGDGTEFAGCLENEFCDVGVLNDGHDDVTVVHGSVREFAFGVCVCARRFVGGARNNRLLGISSSRNLLFGIVFVDSGRSVVRNGSSSRNVPPDGDGIGVFGSHHVRILHNKIRHNPGPAIHLDDSSGNLIERNVFSRNSPGIVLDRADRNRVTRNRCSRNDVCVLVGSGSRNVIAENRVHNGGDGIAIEKGHGNLVVRNDIVGPRKSGVYLAIDRPPMGGHDNVIRRNLVRASGEDAFLVRAEDRHSRLKRNLATGAGGDGFDVESRSAKLTRNRAIRNTDLGIEAVRGVRDGGGNRASGNGDPRQCTHIVCR